VLWTSVCLVCLACSAERHASDSDITREQHEGRRATSTAHHAVEQVLRISLPADTEILLFERESGLDDMLRAKIEMSRTSYLTLAQRLPVPVASMTRGAGRLSADNGAWNPRSTPHLISGQVARAEGRYLNVGVAESSERVTLFIVEHGTLTIRAGRTRSRAPRPAMRQLTGDAASRRGGRSRQPVKHRGSQYRAGLLGELQQ
jgi:hypothetical protein